MEMNESERQQFAARVIAERKVRFGGDKKAAYTAAQVNSATWARVEAGESVKERTIVTIVNNLWPQAAGDWRKVPKSTLSPADVERLAQIALTRDRIAESQGRHVDYFHDIVIKLDDGRELLLDVKMRQVDGREDAVIVDADLLKALVTQTANVLAHYDVEADDEGLAMAARRGVSEGQRLRRVQDAAGEESQDTGGVDPA